MAFYLLKTLITPVLFWIVDTGHRMGEKNPRRPSRKRRSRRYQQLTEFERGPVVGLREGGFSFRDIAECDLAGMYPLCMIVGSSGQGVVLPQEDRVPGGHAALLSGKTAIFGVRLWCIVLRLRQKFE
ncbi:uncharacterized protein TNCV_2089351 [Trichonephila clavipes]|nr:uncharacterized protein TNCV_2089351 [Trichonephila clavipes]